MSLRTTLAPALRSNLRPSPPSSSSSSASSSSRLLNPASRRLASNIPRNTTAPLTAQESSAAQQLDWPTYLALRRSQRLWGLIASIPTTLIGFSAGAGYFVRCPALLSVPHALRPPLTHLARARRPPSRPTRPTPSSGSSPSSSTAPPPSAASASAGSPARQSAAHCGASPTGVSPVPSRQRTRVRPSVLALALPLARSPSPSFEVKGRADPLTAEQTSSATSRAGAPTPPGSPARPPPLLSRPGGPPALSLVRPH